MKLSYPTTSLLSISLLAFPSLAVQIDSNADVLEAPFAFSKRFLTVPSITQDDDSVIAIPQSPPSSTITQTVGNPAASPQSLPSAVPPAGKAGVIGSINLPKSDAITNATSQQFLSDIDFRNAVMNSTSTVRRAHDASALNWNETLATVARARSESCRTKIDAASPFGEVIANKKPDVTRVVNSWASKAKIYDFDSPNAFLKAMLKKTEDAKSIFEFTELVWKNSTQIGCARKDCTKPNSKVETNFLVICELYPKGNVVGRFKENVQANVDGMENGGVNGIGNAGAIGAGNAQKATGKSSDGTRRLDRLQMWCVFTMVWFVLLGVLVE